MATPDVFQAEQSTSDQLSAANPSNATSFTESITAALQDIVSSPLNLVLLSISFYLLYRIFQDYFKKEEPAPHRPPPLPKLPKKDFTLEELRAFNGTGPDGRVLMAVNGKVFDVTRGRSFYGPGGPYEIFAGRDASRGLGTFVLDSAVLRDTYDDLSDLTTDQMTTVKDWEAQFQDKYDLVGRLLRSGETPHDYSLEDDEPSGEQSAAAASAKTSPAAKKSE